MAALSSLSLTAKVSVNGTGTANVTGDDYSNLKQTLNFNKSVGPYTTSVANTVALGADAVYSAITVIASSASADVDLTSLTDILLRTGLDFARIKGYVIRLLSLTDDPDHGSACTGITLQATGTNLIVLPVLTGTLNNGDVLGWLTPTATGVVVDSTHKIIHVVNSDAAHSAAVQITLIGGTT